MSHGAPKTQTNLPQRFVSRERLAFILSHLEIVSARVLWCYRAGERLRGRHCGERTLPGSAGEIAPDVRRCTIPNGVHQGRQTAWTLLQNARISTVKRHPWVEGSPGLLL